MEILVFPGGRHLRLIAPVSMLLLLGLQVPCFAAEELALPKPDITVQTVASQPSPEEMQRQLQALQEKMAAMQQEYDAKLRELNATIQSFTVQISKTGVAPVQPPKPVPADDQQLVDELLFGEDDLSAQQPVSGLTPQTTGAEMLSGGAGNTGLNPSVLGGQARGNGMRLFQNFNPDINVVADFTGYTANHKRDGRNRFSMREVEFGFSAAVDPYARATFYLAKPEGEEMELEEGYLTLLSLPGGLQAKVGKMLSPFGKLNVHTDALPQADRPNVYVNLFGEEGLNETGVALSKILPTPWFSSVDVQLANGENASLFGTNQFSRPMVVGRWKNFFELTNTQFLEIGLSGALGSRIYQPDPTITPDRLYRLSGVQGLDITYRWMPPRQNQMLIWQTEFLAAQMEHPVEGRESVLGGYSFLEYKFHPRWSAGVRADYSEVPLVAGARELAFAPYINFQQSEFGKLSLEYKHTFGKNTPSYDQVWLRYLFFLGPHPAHTF
jgi:hypothetical protein